MFDKESLFRLADIRDRIFSFLHFLVLDILEMIDFVRICLLEHLHDMLQSFIDAEMGGCGDDERMLRQEFFRDLGSDLILFEECEDLFPELLLIFLQDLLVVDEVVFVDQKHHPLLDDEISLFVGVERDEAVIFPDLDLYMFIVTAELIVGVCDDLVEQFRDLGDSFVVSGDIAHQAEHSRFEHMAQERIAEPFAFGSSFDQSRDIYDIEIRLLHRHGTQVRD